MLKKTIKFKKEVKRIRKNYFSLFLEDEIIRGFSNNSTWCYYIENSLKLTKKEKRKIINLINN